MAAGISYPSSALVGGTTARASIFESYVFNSGIHDPEISKVLTYKYPQYYMTTLLDKLGAAEPVAQSSFSWYTMDRTRKSATYTALSGGTGTSPVLTLDITASSPDLGYFQVGDVIRVGKTGALGRVSAIGISGGFQTITINHPNTATSYTNDTNSSTGLPAVTSGDVIGHVFNAFAEGSNGPDGRLFLPTEQYNYTQILKKSMKVTGSEMSNKTILGDGKAWYFTNEEILLKEFARDREVLVMFGKRENTSSIKWSQGIFDFVNSGGILNTYASSTGVSEGDLQNQIEDMLPEGGSSELLVLCGSTFLAKVMRALRDYAVHGQNYGSLGNNMAGLDFTAYKFAGKTIYFAYYELFDDTAVLPYIGTPSASAINFRDFSLWLDMGTDSAGQRLIKLKYKAHNGIQRKFIHKVIPGMVEFDSTGAEGGFAANSFDGVEIQLLSEIGLELRLANRHGILRANS